MNPIRVLIVCLFASALLPPTLVHAVPAAADLPTVEGKPVLARINKEQCLRVEELAVNAGSTLAGKTVGGSMIRKKTRALLVALKRGGTEAYEFNPEDGAEIRENDVLIFIATPESLDEIKALS